MEVRAGLFNGDGEQVERTRGGRVFHFAFAIEARGVARADELAAGLVIRHGAAQVRAAVVQRQQAAIGQSDEVEASVGDVRDRTGREVFDCAQVDDRAKFAFGQAGL